MPSTRSVRWFEDESGWSFSVVSSVDLLEPEGEKPWLWRIVVVSPLTPSKRAVIWFVADETAGEQERKRKSKFLNAVGVKNHDPLVLSEDSEMVEWAKAVLLGKALYVRARKVLGKASMTVMPFGFDMAYGGVLED